MSDRNEAPGNTGRTRAYQAAPRRRRQSSVATQKPAAAGSSLSLTLALRQLKHSPSVGLLLTTLALLAGSRMLQISPSVTFELLAVAIILKLGGWIYSEITAATPLFRSRGITKVLREELLLGLTLLAAAFVRHWGVPVGSILLLAGASLVVQTLRWLAFALRTGAAKRSARPLAESQIKRRVVIVGTGLRARRMADKFLDHPEYQTAVTGFLDYERSDLWRYRDIPLLGHPRSFERFALSLHVDALLLAVGPEEMPHTTSLFTNAERMGITVWLMPELYQPKLSRGELVRLDDSSAIVYAPSRTNRMISGIKELFDRSVALAILVLGFPLFLLTALAIKLDSRGPILFRQERMGRHGRRFMLYKFRTMECDAERKKRSLWSRNEMSGPVFKIKDDPRITWIGHLLRKYSIDEFPQLLNIVRGDMSLVGPRPPLPAEVSRFEPWQRRKLSVKPGLTCLWQVNGRNAIDFDHWMRLDLEYIDNWSLWLDARILMRTVPTVLKGTGV